jgi:hypothetical protein
MLSKLQPLLVLHTVNYTRWNAINSPSVLWNLLHPFRTSFNVHFSNINNIPKIITTCQMLTGRYIMKRISVATPLWAKCEGEAHIPKSGSLKSFGTPKNLELELKGQNTSHWHVLGVIGKVLKRRCLKWTRIDHLAICSPSYGQKKGRESNW